jgi:hypothetical protein
MFVQDMIENDQERARSLLKAYPSLVHAICEIQVMLDLTVKLSHTCTIAEASRNADTIRYTIFFPSSSPAIRANTASPSDCPLNSAAYAGTTAGMGLTFVFGRNDTFHEATVNSSLPAWCERPTIFAYAISSTLPAPTPSRTSADAYADICA